MEYNFKDVEKKWQHYWKEHKTYKVEIDHNKPKYYVLDMFPYPSGAGLHVGHPLGYIASDIYSRYKRLKGFNVLHPMGYDAYGLPAEQYAIQTGQHPAITTNQNINRYREQLDKIGFSFDADREFCTCEPEYYKWTQWAFIQMFNSYFCYDEQQARPITELIQAFETIGSKGMNVACGEEMLFTAEEWKAMSEKEQQQVLMNYRIAYLGEGMVNWCPELGTVLANDEVKDGVSLRGGCSVVQKKMRQWSLRVSAYAQRLLDGLDRVDWPESLKEIQKNWIGRSQGAEIIFNVKDSDVKLEIFTTRPDTIFGVSFMVLAPESDYVKALTTPEQEKEVNEYLEYVAKRTERERQSEVKKVTGAFTGAYAIHPFSGEAIPVWTSEYVLAGYGTGAIMAVPAHDSRDYAFAKKFGMPIIPVIDDGKGCDLSECSYDAKEGKVINSDFINGLEVKEAIGKIAGEVEKRGIGKSKINYRLRDAIFSRQRYWGEPFPVYYKDDMPYMLDESELPLRLPEIDTYLPTEAGDPPLGRAKNWVTKEGYPLELNTMPGFAGSSAYFIRYMDPHNKQKLVDEEACAYWQNVDLYMGGAEHATGHLIYSRFWNMFLYDIGAICENEPFKKLINQGMIQGRSNFVYRIKGSNTFVSYGLKDQYETTEIHVYINLVHNDILDVDAFKKWMPEYATAEFILEDGKYHCGWAVEKMSKSMFNVVNPDDIIEEFGADTLRMYEMFLGPLEAHKPWDTQGIDGVFKFLKKFWRLYIHDGVPTITDEKPSNEELKILHKTLKKIESDIEHFSFNTSIPAFMICTNELTALNCSKREILEPLVIAISPFAPHIAEELWTILGHQESVSKTVFPTWDEKYLIESSFEYPVSFNGKVRFKLEMPIESTNAEIEAAVKAAPESAKWLEGKEIRKMIIVPKKIVNIVL
ncbi:leucine--tRNA ligase [Porphyromonadaceae bacterium OttesenSCG-928-L07]|nr:leucine--tRNA ligase [Porphyromonadaceae bacterium OttesenSCG-928-L07]MDL2330796.1 leucine--tRNA ligase [Odoribacter sp. OttesenSCG-928-A06]